MAACGATADNHCCWVKGACRYFDPDPPDDADGHCSLRYELGSWDAVYADGRYVRDVKPALLGVGVAQDCGDWPPPGETCATCGVTGDG